ncbi:reverse transcriptase domain-containing protein [Tanacetum coccineum]
MTIQATDFGLKNHMIQQVQQSCQYQGLPRDDANKHIDKFFTVTQSMKQNGVLYQQKAKWMSRMTSCAYSHPYLLLTHHATAWFDRLPKNSIHSWEDIVTEFLSKYFPPSMNMIAHHKDWDTFAQRSESSSSNTSSSFDMAAISKQLAGMNKTIQRMSQSSQLVQAVNQSYETCGGPHPYYECQASRGFTQEDVYAAMASKEKEILEPNPHQPLIPYPSRLNKEKLQDKSDIQITKFLEIFKKLHFNISLVDALAQMPKYAKMLTDLLTNKEKLLELANTALNENCSVVLLNKLLEKLGDPGKFLIPCYFKELEVCMSLADLGASINLMPLFVYQKLKLVELKNESINKIDIY